MTSIRNANTSSTFQRNRDIPLLFGVGTGDYVEKLARTRIEHDDFSELNWVERLATRPSRWEAFSEEKSRFGKERVQLIEEGKRKGRVFAERYIEAKTTDDQHLLESMVTNNRRPAVRDHIRSLKHAFSDSYFGAAAEKSLGYYKWDADVEAGILTPFTTDELARIKTMGRLPEGLEGHHAFSVKASQAEGSIEALSKVRDPSNIVPMDRQTHISDKIVGHGGNTQNETYLEVTSLQEDTESIVSTKRAELANTTLLENDLLLFGGSVLSLAAFQTFRALRAEQTSIERLKFVTSETGWAVPTVGTLYVTRHFISDLAMEGIESGLLELAPLGGAMFVGSFMRAARAGLQANDFGQAIDSLSLSVRKDVPLLGTLAVVQIASTSITGEPVSSLGLAAIRLSYAGFKHLANKTLAADLESISLAHYQKAALSN